MNYNTIVTPQQPLPCTPDEAVQIQRLLTQAEENEPHGFRFLVESENGYLEAEETGNWDSLPDDVLDLVAGLIKRASLEFLEFGVAFTAGRMVPGSHGGTAFRIYADGSIVNRVETWPEVSMDGAPKERVPDEWCVCLWTQKHRMSEHGATPEWYDTHEWYVPEELA
jgi:hypothetical protein